MPHLSIVSPVYKTGSILPELVRQLGEALPAITTDYEIILVDDASPDDAWTNLVTLCEKDRRIKAIRLSRNFGQHAALTAGLKHAGGKWIVVMDSDLEDIPGEIARLYEQAIKGYDIVIAKRVGKTHSLFRRLASKLFYRWLTWLSGLPSDYTVANFGIYSRQVIDEVIAMPETHRFFPMIINWVGFRRTSIEYKHGTREDGKSGYDTKKLFNLALDITLAYSDKPLRYVARLGFIISAATFIYSLVVLVRYFMGDIIVLGYTSLILSIWFLGGIILFTLGVVGLYVGRTFEETKRRPLYIIEKEINARL
ncbi:MAG TPA: glycosyltransferase family 2 protein [Chitinophagaceae bacterium]|jgi:dolichol-phosphate mannosyltransferase